MNFPQFLTDFQKLKLLNPHPLPFVIESENSEYGDYLAYCKNAYFSFDTSYSENIVYIFDSHKANYCCDGDYVVESENCYDSVDVFKSYDCAFINYCARLYDSYFCFDCNDSNNLFGCVYLNFKQYCIFNKQYTKEVYAQKVKELLKKPVEENFNDMKKLLPIFPVTTSHVSHAENSDYNDHVHYSKNMYLCFDSARSEDCEYLYDSHRNKNCADLTQTFSSEFSYECVDSNKLSNCFFMKDCDHVLDSGFSENCTDSNHLFGCVGLKNMEYCFLNKKYSKEEYNMLVKTVRESLKGNSFKQEVPETKSAEVFP